MGAVAFAPITVAHHAPAIFNPGIFQDGAAIAKAAAFFESGQDFGLHVVVRINQLVLAVPAGFVRIAGKDASLQLVRIAFVEYINPVDDIVGAREAGQQVERLVRRAIL